MRRGWLAVLVVVLLALAGCGSDAAAQSEGTGFVAGDGSVVELAPADRAPAPSFAGTTLDGTTLGSEDLRGRVAVLNVWASWCAPCRAEAPALQRLWTEFEDRGVAFVGLDTRDSDAAARAFVDRFGITYPNVIDRDGAIQLLFRDSLPPQAIPSTLVLDRQGRVAARFLGIVEESTLGSVVESLLDEAP